MCFVNEMKIEEKRNNYIICAAGLYFNWTLRTVCLLNRKVRKVFQNLIINLTCVLCLSGFSVYFSLSSASLSYQLDFDFILSFSSTHSLNSFNLFLYIVFIFSISNFVLRTFKFYIFLYSFVFFSFVFLILFLSFRLISQIPSFINQFFCIFVLCFYIFLRKA